MSPASAAAARTCGGRPDQSTTTTPETTMTDPRIAVLAAISSPDWHPVPEAHGMPWDEAEQLLAAYDASRAAAPSAPADSDLRDRIAEALLDHLSRTADIRPTATGEQAFMPEVTDEERLRFADAVLAVLPAPADRAAVLREAADRAEAFRGDWPLVASWLRSLAMEAKLRRMADEAQRAPACGDSQHRHTGPCGVYASPARGGADEAQPAETVHGCPPDGSGLTPCCGRPPFELPLTDRISSEAPTTCPGPTAEADRG